MLSKVLKIRVQMFCCMKHSILTPIFCHLPVLFLIFLIVDQSKEATFKVAPSKWEAVDEAELEAQGKTYNWH